MNKKKTASRYYLPRDVSWMYFNHRILQEAMREDVPLLERLSFLGIYSNNLDEFFRVRVATQNRVAECEDRSARNESAAARQLLKQIGKLNAEYAREYETAVRHCLPLIFAGTGHSQFEAYAFKFTKDAEMEIDNDLRNGLLLKISKGVKSRKRGEPLRVIYDARMPRDLLKKLLDRLGVDKTDTVLSGGRYHNHKGLMRFPDCGRSDLKYPAWCPFDQPELTGEESILMQIRRKDRFVHVPYHSFDSYVRVLQEAAIHREVKSIKTTLYRLAKDSKVVKALITAARSIVADVASVFRFIERPYSPVRFKELFVSPNEMRQKFVRLINNEIKNREAGRPAYIRVKVNHVTDPALVEKLYEAAVTGVPVDMVVRGNCSLMPGPAGLEDTMHITGIIDRYLEHARIFVFAAGGEEKVFMGSADWMPRNLANRVEVVTPVYDADIKQELKRIVDYGLRDTSQGRRVDGTGNDPLRTAGGEARFRSQEELYNYYKKVTANEKE